EDLAPRPQPRNPPQLPKAHQGTRPLLPEHPSPPRPETTRHVPLPGPRQPPRPAPHSSTRALERELHNPISTTAAPCPLLHRRLDYARHAGSTLQRVQAPHLIVRLAVRDLL